jgi:hypothetical protein
MFTEGPKVPRGTNVRFVGQDPSSHELNPRIDAGGAFVYVVDTQDRVYVAADGPGKHPYVLGGGVPGLYAGEIRLNAAGEVIELNNCSGAFRFRRAEGLQCVARALMRQGVSIRSHALSFFDQAGKQAVPLPSIP